MALLPRDEAKLIVIVSMNLSGNNTDNQPANNPFAYYGACLL